MLLICMGGGALCLAAENRGLASHSPFLPDNFTPPSGNQPATPGAVPPEARFIEFRGVYQLGGTYHFNFFDKRANKGSWVRMDAPSDGYEVTSFDASSNAVRLRVNGEVVELTLASPTDRPLPVAGATPVPTPVPAATPAGAPTVTPSAEDASPRPAVRRRVIRPPSRSTPVQPARRITVPPAGT